MTELSCQFMQSVQKNYTSTFDSRCVILCKKNYTSTFDSHRLPAASRTLGLNIRNYGQSTQTLAEETFDQGEGDTSITV